MGLCLQVILIPTVDSMAMHQWFEETGAQHQAQHHGAGQYSTVSMQDKAWKDGGPALPHPYPHSIPPFRPHLPLSLLSLHQK